MIEWSFNPPKGTETVTIQFQGDVRIQSIAYVLRLAWYRRLWNRVRRRPPGATS